MNQSASNVLAAIKRETTAGTPAAGGSGAYVLPLVDSPGLRYERGRIASARRRRDQITAMGRLGGASAAGTYNTELVPGGAIDLLLESAARGTWVAALSPAIANVTNTGTVITRAAGSFITDGFRAGDVIRFSGDATAANNGPPFRVQSVTALTMTVATTPTLTSNAVARTVTINRWKKVFAPQNAVYHSYTIEQMDEDIEESELFLGERLTGLALSMRPNSPVTAAWSFQGLNRTLVDTASWPYFTNPSELAADVLIADDSWIRYKGVDVATITGFDLNLPIAAALQPTIGSIVSPDVFMNDMTPAGTIMSVRSSLLALADFDAETEFEIQIVMTLPGDLEGIALYLPRVKIGGIDAPFLGGDAAKVETRELMIATHAGDTDTDNTALVFMSTGA